MARCLIISNAFNIHAYAVKWAIERMGFHVSVWVLPDFPTSQKISIEFDDQSPEENRLIDGPNAEIRKTDSYTSVWLRRIPYLLPTGDNLHPADVEIVERESRHFMKGALNSICSNGFWVNPPKARESAQYKIYQMAKAREVGLSVPSTLYSNDPALIERFVKKNIDVVFKSFLPVGWSVNDRIMRLWTTRISLDDINRSWDEISRCPAIYQERIEKKYEIRLTIIGKTFFCS